MSEDKDRGQPRPAAKPAARTAPDTAPSDPADDLSDLERTRELPPGSRIASAWPRPAPRSVRPGAPGMPASSVPHPSLGSALFPGLQRTSSKPPPPEAARPPAPASRVPPPPVVLPVEEISSSVLLPDESGAAAAPDAEELSGSLLIEEPADGVGPPVVTRLQPGAAPAPEPVEPAHRALLGMPTLPTATPGPALPLQGHAAAEIAGDPAGHTPWSDAPVHTDAPGDEDEMLGEPMPEGAPDAAGHPGNAEGSRPPVSSEPPPPARGGLPVALERALERGSDVLRRARHALLASTEERPGGKARWMLPAVTLAGLLAGLAFVGVLFAVIGPRKGAAATTGEPARGASVGSALPAPAPAAPASTPPAPPPAPVQACTVTASPQTIAPFAMVSAGVEVRPFGDGIAIGFAASDREARGVRIDPATLAAEGAVAARAQDTIRRVRPLVAPRDAMGLAVDTEGKRDRVQGRRTLPLDPPLQAGASGGDLVWTRPGAGPAGKLWPLPGSDDVDALRAASEGAPGDTTTAIAFRRANAVWIGTATGYRALAPKGDLSRIDGLGPAVGSPAVAVSDGTVVVAWADRPSADVPWRLRLVHMKAGDAAGEATTFSPPPGGPGGHVMSPGLAAVPGGRFLLVWTEGPTAQQRVRAVTLSPSAEPVGKALEISRESIHSGQGQAAVTAGPGAKGVVAFLQASGDGFEVAATPVACGD